MQINTNNSAKLWTAVCNIVLRGIFWDVPQPVPDQPCHRWHTCTTAFESGGITLSQFIVFIHTKYIKNEETITALRQHCNFYINNIVKSVLLYNLCIKSSCTAAVNSLCKSVPIFVMLCLNFKLNNWMISRNFKICRGASFF